MTLHVLNNTHYDFLVNCYRNGGFSDVESRQRAVDTLDVATGYEYPVYFVGPSLDKPRYYIGAYVDDNNRAFLDAGTIATPGPVLYRDGKAWLDYVCNELGVQLLEAFVWVEDLQKEWFLRAIGFRKGGVIPSKVDIPGKGPQAALSMWIRPQEFNAVTNESFRAKLKQYRDHSKKVRLLRQTESLTADERKQA